MSDYQLLSDESKKKWSTSIFGGFLFAGISSHYTYKLTSKAFSPGTLTNPQGCPTGIGLLLHTLIFILIVRYFMALGNCGMREPETVEMYQKKNMISLFSGAVFAVVSSPYMHALISGKNEQCTLKSTAITTLIYILVIRMSMNLEIF
jgi:hypothetical protein